MLKLLLWAALVPAKGLVPAPFKQWATAGSLSVQDFQGVRGVSTEEDLPVGARIIAVPAAEALQARRETLGDRHPSTLTSISNMGTLLHDMGKLEQARPLFEEALQGRRETLGDRHPDTLMSIGQPLNWIANLTVSTLFPILFVAMGRYAYLIFVALTAFFGWFTYTKLPETKGRTIAQVTEEFKRY